MSQNPYDCGPTTYWVVKDRERQLKKEIKLLKRSLNDARQKLGMMPVPEPEPAPPARKVRLRD